MSKHVTYRGVTIDMESLRRENEKAVAIGNMKVNARGDLIQNGVVTKTADQLARENHRVQTAVVSTSLKGKQPEATGITLDPPKPTKTRSPSASTKKTVEKELPSGDIIIEGESGDKAS